MAFENGVEWKPLEPEKRGRHSSITTAFDAALKDLLTEKSEFFENLCDNWKRLFPEIPARPGRHEDGKIVLYVGNSSILFMLRPQLKKFASKLATLPGAPKKIDLRLEIHAS